MARVEYYNSKLQNKNVKKMLDLLAYTEGTDKLHGYNTLVGGRRINDLSEHPNIVGLRTKDGASTAFGRYQITGSTWRELQKSLGFGDFSPRTQDLAAVALLDKRGALKDVERGNFKSAIDKLGSEWVSLPTSTTRNQGHRSWSDVAKFIRSLESRPENEDYSGKINGDERLRNQYIEGLEGGRNNALDTIQNVYNAYRSGVMSPQEAADFEEDVRSNKIMLPRGATLLTDQPPRALTQEQTPIQEQQPLQGQPSSTQELPKGVIDAYNNGIMTRQEMMELERDIKEGLVRAPQGFQPQNTQPLGFFGGIKEAITGADRQTEDTKTLPDYVNMPERNELSFTGFKTALGSLVSSPRETVQIIKANYPGVEVAEDAKGNLKLKSKVDGKWYIVQPGATPEDVAKLVIGAALFAPAAAIGAPVTAGAAAGAAATRVLPSLLGSVGGAALTQAGIEASQAATGGNFDPGDVALAGAGQGLGTVAGNVINKGIVTPARNVINKALGRTPPVTDEVLQAAKTGAVTSEGAPILSQQELNETARRASTGGLSSSKEMQILATQAQPNPKTVEAAKRLGVDEYLQPDLVTKSQPFRELAQAVKTVPGSEARAIELENLKEVSRKAEDLIEKIGGSRDVSILDSSVKKEYAETIKSLEDKADVLFDQLRNDIPEMAEAQAPNVLKFINERAVKLKGVDNLTGMERSILRKLSPKKPIDAPEGAPAIEQPTYYLLDDVRRDLTAARVKKEGIYRKADSGLIKKLESELKKDQGAVVEQYGMTDMFKEANKSVAIRKDLEDKSIKLLGKTLSGSIVPQVSGATSALAKGDTSKFINLLQLIPENQKKETVGEVLRYALTNGKDVNFSNFSNWWEGLLRNKKSAAAVLSNLPREAKKNLFDLYRVSKGISLASKERIPTGRLQAVTEQIKGADSLIGTLYEKAKQSVAGGAMELVSTPLGVPGAGFSASVAAALAKNKTSALKAVDSLLASPEFVVLAKNLGTVKESKLSRIVARSKAFKRFIGSLGDPRGLKNPERFLNSLLQANRNINKEETPKFRNLNATVNDKD